VKAIKISIFHAKLYLKRPSFYVLLFFTSILLTYIFVRSVTQVETQLLNDQIQFKGNFPFMLVIQQVLNSALLIFCFLIPLIVNSSFYEKGMGALTKCYTHLGLSSFQKVLGIYLSLLFVLMSVCALIAVMFLIAYFFIPLDGAILLQIIVALSLFIMGFTAINLFISLVSSRLVFGFLFSTLLNYFIFFSGDFYLTFKDDFASNVFKQISVPYHFSQAVAGASIIPGSLLFIGLAGFFIYLSFRFENIKKWIN
jgi:hypothetical protein